MQEFVIFNKNCYLCLSKTNTTMKQVSFTPGIESISGILRNKRVLNYPKSNNPAWDQPSGKQYARNYKASIVLANRRSDGANYFQLKTRSASNMTPKARRVQALLGAVSIIRSYLKSTGDLEKLYDDYSILKADGRLSTELNTFNKWFFYQMSQMLTSKQNSRTIAYGGEGFVNVTVYNPWSMLTTEAPVIPFESFIKFAPYFAYSRVGSDVMPGAVFFKVDGVTYLSPYVSVSQVAEFNALTAASTANNPNTHYAGWSDNQGNLLVNGLQVYDAEGSTVSTGDIVTEVELPLTTTPPQS